MNAGIGGSADAALSDFNGCAIVLGAAILWCNFTFCWALMLGFLPIFKICYSAYRKNSNIIRTLVQYAPDLYSSILYLFFKLRSTYYSRSA